MGIPKVRLERTWAARDVQKGFGSAVGDVLLEFHWNPIEDLPELDEDNPSARLEIWSGSQRTLWLLGTWLVSDSSLPLSGSIGRTLWVDNDRLQQINVQLEDNIGFGLMDPYTAWRFRRAFGRFAAAIESALQEHCSAFSAGEDPPPETGGGPSA